MARREGRVWRESSSERDEGSTGGVVLFIQSRGLLIQSRGVLIQSRGLLIQSRGLLIENRRRLLIENRRGLLIEGDGRGGWELGATTR